MEFGNFKEDFGANGHPVHRRNQGWRPVHGSDRNNSNGNGSHAFQLPSNGESNSRDGSRHAMDQGRFQEQSRRAYGNGVPKFPQASKSRSNRGSSGRVPSTDAPSEGRPIPSTQQAPKVAPEQQGILPLVLSQAPETEMDRKSQSEAGSQVSGAAEGVNPNSDEELQKALTEVVSRREIVQRQEVEIRAFISARTQIKSLQDELSEEKSKSAGIEASFNEKLQDGFTKVKESEEQVGHLQSRIHELEQSLQVMEGESSSRVWRLEAQLHEKNKEAESLRAELDNIAVQGKAKESQIADLMAQIDGLNKDKATQYEEVQKLQKEAQALRDDNWEKEERARAAEAWGQEAHSSMSQNHNANLSLQEMTEQYNQLLMMHQIQNAQMMDWERYYQQLIHGLQLENQELREMHRQLAENGHFQPGVQIQNKHSTREAVRTAGQTIAPNTSHPGTVGSHHPLGNGGFPPHGPPLHPSQVPPHIGMGPTVPPLGSLPPIPPPQQAGIPLHLMANQNQPILGRQVSRGHEPGQAAPHHMPFPTPHSGMSLPSQQTSLSLSAAQKQGSSIGAAMPAQLPIPSGPAQGDINRPTEGSHGASSSESSSSLPVVVGSVTLDALLPGASQPLPLGLEDHGSRIAQVENKSSGELSSKEGQPTEQQEGSDVDRSPLERNILLTNVLRTLPDDPNTQTPINTVTNRLSKVLAPRTWDSYAAKYGQLVDFIKSFPELFVIVEEYVSLKEGARAMVAAQASSQVHALRSARTPVHSGATPAGPVTLQSSAVRQQATSLSGRRVAGSK